LRSPAHDIVFIAMSSFSLSAETQLLPAEYVGEASDRDLAEWGLTPLLEYWNKARGQAFAPRWTDFNIIELPPQVRGGLVVVDYDPTRGDFHVRFWGVDLWDIFGIDITGAWLSEIEHFGVMTLFHKQGLSILTTKAPQKLIHRARKTTGTTEIYPVLRLPISDDGINVTKIITARNAKRLGRRHSKIGGG
jgi:hypothetical protein